MPTSQAWCAALDEFEFNLNCIRDQIEDGTVGESRETGIGIWPPVGVAGQPLPMELAERARELIHKSEAIQRSVSELKDALPVGGSVVRRPRYARSKPTSRRVSCDL